jgi:hypothetical protein
LKMDASILTELTGRQRAVAQLYLTTLGPSVDDLRAYRAGWQGEADGASIPRRVQTIVRLRIPLRDGSAVYFFGSLGDSQAESGEQVGHEHHFICMFDEEHSDIVSMVSHARVHHALLGTLDAHSSFLLDEESPLRARGYTSVLVTRADHLRAAALDADSTFLLEETSPLRRRGYTNALVTTAALFTPFRDKTDATLEGMPMRFFALTPLEPNEWHLKVENGVVGLFDHFRARGRDLLRLRAPA